MPYLCALVYDLTTDRDGFTGVLPLVLMSLARIYSPYQCRNGDGDTGLHAKQPKRGTIAWRNLYRTRYPRAKGSYHLTLRRWLWGVIEAGGNQKALQYEVLDMEAAVAGEDDHTCAVNISDRPRSAHLYRRS